MKPNISNEEEQVIGTNNSPSVSIILPIETDISLISELKHKLKITQEKVERELSANYPDDRSKPVIKKLEHLMLNIDFTKVKQSIAIYVSPIDEKVFYLNIPVKEKIIIDQSFEIRDLIYNNKQTVQFLVLLLSADTAKFYLGDSSELFRIKSGFPENIQAYERDMPERVTNFSDPDAHKEDVLNHFLQHTDQALSQVIKTHPLQVFIIGTERVLGHYKKITKNEKNILQFIYGNHIDDTEHQLQELIEPYKSTLFKIREVDVLHQLEQAVNEHKLSCGMQEAWSAASKKNAKLLVVEKDFMYPAHRGKHTGSVYKEDFSLNDPFYVKDAVDDTMEKVLACGGDVEFVDTDVLKDYGHVALINYY